MIHTVVEGIGGLFNKSEVVAATSDTAELPSAYSVDQIISCSMLSLLEITKLVTTLLERAESGGANQRFKAVRIMLEGSKKGHVNFRLEVRGTCIGVLRKLTGWEGPSDPAYGDYYNERLRSIASECLSVALSDDFDSVERRTHADRIVGYGQLNQPPESGNWLSNNITSWSAWAGSWVGYEISSLAQPVPPPPPPSSYSVPDLVNTDLSSSVCCLKTVFKPPTKPKVVPPQKAMFSSKHPLSLSHPWQHRLTYIRSVKRDCRTTSGRETHSQDSELLERLQKQDQCSQASVKIAANKLISILTN